MLTNEEIGISESSGALGLSRNEELQLGIESIKQRIIEAENDPDTKSLLIEKLIELRSELQDLNGERLGGEKVTRRLGHELCHEPKEAESYCEQCLAACWSSRAVAKCQSCGLFVHQKCIRAIARRCQGQGGAYLLQITPEKGLAYQKYRCKDCRCRIGVNPNDAKAGTVEARLCSYSGYYYCPACHWNDLKIIPARIILNWDFNEYEVCRSSFRYLSSAFKRTLVNIEKENDQLYSFVEELQQIRKLRQDVLRMKVYLSCCPEASGSRLLLRLQYRQHFVESSDEYTLHDLIEIASGSLIDSLTEIHADYARHIKLDCVRCQAKGFICEICTNGNELFPFDSIASSCTKCGAVYHKECFMSLTGVKGCPRCSRIEEKESRILVEPTPATTTEIRKFNPFMRSDERLPNSPSPSFL